MKSSCLSLRSIFFLISLSFLFNTTVFAHSNTYSNTSSETPSLIVNILQIVEHEALNQTRKGIEEELKNAGIQYRYESAQGNPALASQIAQKFKGDRPNAMVGIGTTATQALIASNRQCDIPIIFSSVTDPVGSRIVTQLKHPSACITGVSNFIPPKQQFALFKKILPKLKRLGIIYNPGETNSVSLLSTMTKEATPFGIELINAGAYNTKEVVDATLSLINKVDAIFINNDNTALSAFDAIINIATPHKIPVFVSDTDMLSKGALAALGPKQYELGKQTGKMIIELLLQKKSPQEISVQFPEKIELHLNLKIADALHIKIPTEIQKEATYLYDNK